MHTPEDETPGLSDFLRDTSGATMMEYALLASLALVVMLIAVLAVIGPKA